MDFICGNVRVQFLGKNILRLEEKKNGRFCDEDTFLIPNRGEFPRDEAVYTEEENVLCFGDYELYLAPDGKSLAGTRLEKNGRRVYTYRPLKNTGNLPSLARTPEVFALSDTPHVFVPKGGYSADRRGEYIIEENVKDIYLLLCGTDAHFLRELYVSLTGRCELVRLSTLGSWNSKYYNYTEETAKGVILDYEAHRVPLDNLVIDTGWRDSANGWGYDINTSLFPDMKRFLDFAHSHGIEVMFNDHPEPKDGAYIFDEKEIAYREKSLQGLLSLGVDTWWYDRNWGTALKSPTAGIPHETLGMYLFSDITKHYYQRAAGNDRIYRRPVIMGNADNVSHGGYMGIRSSASHRYSIQWTGDITCDANARATEVSNLIRGGNDCIAYINADCGGHFGNPDKTEFVRWMQFGALSPIFRPHCTRRVERYREPWVYDEETLGIVREYNNLRYRLLPVIYTSAYRNYRTGAPIFRALGWNYPKDKRALARRDEYMLGENLLIAPIVGYEPLPLEKSRYLAPVSAAYFRGRLWEGEPILHKEYATLSMYRDNTPVEDGVPVYDFSAKYTTTVCFDKPVRLFLRVDDGATVYIDGKKVFEDNTYHTAFTYEIAEFDDCLPHDLRIDYFQVVGEACCMLLYAPVRDLEKREIYLPDGNWKDLFDGRVYRGGRVVRKEYNLSQMPLFLRMGAVIPLAYDAKNTEEQKWDRLVFDVYPDPVAGDSGSLYEDDTETTAYRWGEYRESGYGAAYCGDCSAYVVRLDAAEGEFSGDRSFDKRCVTVKFHLTKEFPAVREVTVNGEKTPFTLVKRDASAFPLGTAASPTEDTVLVTFRTDVRRAALVKFFF